MINIIRTVPETFVCKEDDRCNIYLRMEPRVKKTIRKTCLLSHFKIGIYIINL